MQSFKHQSDRNFFIKALADGDEELFEKKYLKLFDFRDSKIKRSEFNLIRNEAYKKLVSKYGEECQLKLCLDCSQKRVFAVDHYIPISSNELNKKLRHMKPAEGKKVPAQSFGSNHIENLRIACEKCNNFKKHRLMF